MNKTDLIAHIAGETGFSKADAERALTAVLRGVTDSLKQGEPVAIVGFGQFSVNERAARAGRNPRTGELIPIEASKSVKFTAGKVLKAAVN